jgi:hypothetical protein
MIWNLLKSKRFFISKIRSLLLSLVEEDRDNNDFKMSLAGLKFSYLLMLNPKIN